LLAKAAEAGVSFLPGWHCFAGDPEETYLRLNFTFPQEDQIEPGISRLMAAVRHSSAGSRERGLARAGTPPIV